MKSSAEAKTRLASVMSPERRAHLALTLFDRAQTFFAAQFPLIERLVVTPSREIAQRSIAAGARVLLEPGTDGLNPAASRSLDWAVANGFERLLFVPADIPVWLQHEVRALLALSEHLHVVIGRAHDGGTNALLFNLRRVQSFEFCYGTSSALRHADACRRAGLSFESCCPPFMSHDIDTASDCLVLSHALRSIRTI